MDTVKSNAEKNIPFQLLYYGVTSGISSVQLLPVSLYGIPLANMFTLYVNVDSVTNNAVCQSGVTTEIPINQAYIGGDTANISINVII